jgi:hypothetical protein
MVMKSLTCPCGAEFSHAEAFVNHAIETGHGVSLTVREKLEQNEQVRNEFIAILMAIQTCNSPEEIEEIGGQPCSKEEYEQAKRKGEATLKIKREK